MAKKKMKICSKCDEEKLLSEFDKQKNGRYGVTSICKICKSEYMKKYYTENDEELRRKSKNWNHKNKAKAKAKAKKWMDAHPGYYKARSREYRKLFPERIKESQARWVKDNKERHAKNCKDWYNENKEKCIERAYVAKHKRRTRILGNGGSFTVKEWRDLCEKYGKKCLCCKKKKKLTADHVIPISKGGTSFIRNIQPLCGSCNSSKGNRSSIDYR